MAKPQKKQVYSPRPVLAEVSPVIQTYNYTYDTHGAGMETMDGLMTGDEIAGIGIQDLDRNGTAPQGYPWSGHELPPAYPWEGHAASTPNTGIEGRSPLTQGGPNFPAPSVSTAYPQIDPQSGGGYPYAPATQMGPPPGHAPAAAAFGGLDLGQLDAHLHAVVPDMGRTKRTKKVKSRDVPGQNGIYTYRQFSNGDIKVLDTSDPAGRSMVGTTITQGDPRWQAITSDIGTWADYKSGRIGSRIGLATQLLNVGTDTYTKIKGGQQAPRRSKSKRAAAGPSAATPAPYMAPALPSVPTWAKVAGGVTGTALLLFVVYQLATPAKD